MKIKVILLLWIAGMIFPLNFMIRLFPKTGDFFYWALQFEWVHILAHLFLYAVLSFLALKLFYGPSSSPSLPALSILVGFIISVGLIQEIFQLISKHRSFGRPEVFDLFIDLAAALIVWYFYTRVPATQSSE